MNRAPWFAGGAALIVIALCVTAVRYPLETAMAVGFLLGAGGAVSRRRRR